MKRKIKSNNKQITHYNQLRYNVGCQQIHERQKYFQTIAMCMCKLGGHISNLFPRRNFSLLLQQVASLIRIIIQFDY